MEPIKSAFSTRLDDILSETETRWLRTKASSDYFHYLSALDMAGRTREVEERLNEWLKNAPNDAYARYYLGNRGKYSSDKNAAVWREDFDQGFVCGFRGPRLPDIPIWPWQSEKNCRLLIWGEDGIGDILRHSARIREIARDGLEISFAVPPKLLPLFEASSENIFKAITRADALDTIERFDYQIASGSLELMLVSKDNPQITRHLDFDRAALPDWLLRFLQKYGSKGKPERRRPVIGFCFRSKLLGGTRTIHYTAFEEWFPFFEKYDAIFVSLQYDLDDLKQAGLPAHLAHKVISVCELDLFDDILGQAQLIKQLDKVISVGTAAADLAGAVGTICWRLQAGWLGGKKPITDLDGYNMWYGRGVHMFYRDPRENWNGVFKRIDQSFSAYKNDWGRK